MQTEAKIIVDQHTYHQVVEILRNIGMDYSQAINLFNKMVVYQKGLPFEYKHPNQETLTAMEEAKKLDGEFITIEDLSR